MARAALVSTDAEYALRRCDVVALRYTVRDGISKRSASASRRTELVKRPHTRAKTVEAASDGLCDICSCRRRAPSTPLPAGARAAAAPRRRGCRPPARPAQRRGRARLHTPARRAGAGALRPGRGPLACPLRARGRELCLAESQLALGAVAALGGPGAPGAAAALGQLARQHRVPNVEAMLRGLTRRGGGAEAW